MGKRKTLQEELEKELGEGIWERYGALGTEVQAAVVAAHNAWVNQGDNIRDLQGSHNKMISLIREAVAKHEKASNQ
jgi:hypothetical protein